MRSWLAPHNAASNSELGISGNVIRLTYGIGFVEYVDFVINEITGEFEIRNSPYRFPNPDGYWQTSGRFLNPDTLIFWEQREPVPYQGRRCFLSLPPVIDFNVITYSHWDVKHAATDYRAKNGTFVEGVPNAIYANGVQLFHSGIACAGSGPTAGGWIATSDPSNGPLVIRDPNFNIMTETPRVPMTGRDVEEQGFILYGNGSSWVRKPDGTHLEVTTESGEGIGCLVRVKGELWVANHHSLYTMLHPYLLKKFIKVDGFVTYIKAVSLDKWIILVTENAGLLTLHTIDSTSLSTGDNDALILAKLTHMEQDIAEIRSLITNG